ncbi:M23 family metallopeptidase [Altererythrobacter sp. HHU K3-1]|uniref:M23 family metallopeptidase n=2 Tax=Qipengyuania atrilutea TaxID=2744473 RepID=A0A850H1M5_9SPHN|nr:M23 family metallopeptidase [Actirhodobacter atriluteus]
MRSQGQVRFITVTSRFQMIAAAIVLAALLGWAVSLAMMGWTQYRAQADLASLSQREAKVTTAEERVEAYRDNIGEVAADLEKRQEFLENMVPTLPEDLVAEVSGAESTTEAARTVSKISAVLPEAAALARMEKRQLDFVEKLTHLADYRAERAETALRKLGLDPSAVLRKAEREAMGGPLERLSTASDGSIDPRFERMGLSLARMSALEQVLDGVPQVLPASIESISSGFGYRRDPFSGSGAMHNGLDFRGATGTPIRSAAEGKVTFVGRKGGYGKVVEISHGNGLMTRYAHMSRFAAKVGMRVDAGDVIGAIGSTGRSTGPHLHFEVRIHNRPVNPRPFLETAPHVLKEVRAVPGKPHEDA